MEFLTQAGAKFHAPTGSLLVCSSKTDTPCYAFAFTPLAALGILIVLALYRYLVLRNREGYTQIGQRNRMPSATLEEDPGDLIHSTDVSRLPHQGSKSLLNGIIIMNLAIIITFLADAAIVCIRALITKKWTPTYYVVYIAASWLAWAFNFAEFYVLERRMVGEPSLINHVFWWLAIIFESFVGSQWIAEFVRPEIAISRWDIAFMSVFSVRYLLVFLVFAFSAMHYFGWFATGGDLESAASPIVESRGANEASSYGTFNRAQSGTTSTANGISNLPSSQPSGLVDFYRKMKKLMPFIWPKKNVGLQFVVIACYILLAIGRGVNILVPRQMKIVIDQLAGDRPHLSWGAILLYVFLRFLQGESGILRAIQSYLWIPISQYTTRELSVKLFEHLHNLSLRFHVNRKTGEVLRVMDRGTQSIVSLLSQINFQIFPVILDIILAVIYLTSRFDAVFGFIVFMTMTLYIGVTVGITEWRTKFRREMIECDNDSRAKAVDSLLNFETVKYYSAEQFEVKRYDDSIVKFQRSEYKTLISLNYLNLAQNFVISGGLLAGCLLCAWRVSLGQLTVGDFVMFLTYINQLYTPLNFFGTYYRLIQANFIDMEKMLDLFEEHQSVQDRPNAPPLHVTEGTVVFENVCFSYDKRQQALRNISFTIPKGKTVALVGESGGGKSTILRLLFRFYDVDSGRILVDGQDIREVTQSSLRRNIGVVPQDTVLFNETIFYNIHYGNIDAPEESVYAAARAAQIHDRILSFPDGYETRVGERGLRLSGGEKQRVAIARTILKNPPIILLDEATSALDTTTERNIQQAFATMTAGRTTLVIAHRLSTIVNSDLILCIRDGQVVESGTHEELLARGPQGIYYEMWQKQLEKEGAPGSTGGSGSVTPVEGLVENDPKRILQPEVTGHIQPTAEPSNVPGTADTQQAIVESGMLAKEEPAKTGEAVEEEEEEEDKSNDDDPAASSSTPPAKAPSGGVNKSRKKKKSKRKRSRLI
ncbi:uncharacterized protein VTP21DRAFT_86 [Calcarisporiella thermophila]|uniref:uncharacterized protein n=1 Tax=Calcarisporiella thermophila TaxID=911321 RepID=UPI0037421CD8